MTLLCLLGYEEPAGKSHVYVKDLQVSDDGLETN